MSLERQHAFRELEPPPGGPERLRRRLDERGRRNPRTRALLAAAAGGAAAAAIAIALVVAPVTRTDRDEPRDVASLHDAAQFDRLLGRPLEETELSVARGEPSSVSKVDSSNPRIRIYEIE